MNENNVSAFNAEMLLLINELNIFTKELSENKKNLNNKSDIDEFKMKQNNIDICMNKYRNKKEVTEDKE